MSMSCFDRDRVEPNETLLRRTKSSRPLTLPIEPTNLLRRISEFPQIQLSEACSYRPIKSGGCPPPGVAIHLTLLCLFFYKVPDQHYKVHYALYSAKPSTVKRVLVTDVKSLTLLLLLLKEHHDHFRGK